MMHLVLAVFTRRPTCSKRLIAVPGEDSAKEVVDFAHEVDGVALFDYVVEAFLLGWIFGVKYKVIKVNSDIDL